MRFSDNVSMAFSDLNRRKKRTFLTSLGITVGAVLIILMVSLGMMMKGFLVATVNSGSSTRNITVNPIVEGAKVPDNPKEMAKEMPLWIKNNFKKIDNNTVEQISKIPNVSGVKAYIGVGLAKVEINNKDYYGNFPVRGYDLKNNIYFDTDIDSAKSSAKNVDFNPIIAGKALDEGNGSDGILVGEALLNKIGVANPSEIVGKQITFDIDNINGRAVKPMKETFKVVGVESKYMPNGNKFIISAKNVAKIAGFLQYNSNFMNVYGYNSLVVQANNIDNIAAIQQGIEKIGYSTTSDEQKTNSINENFNNILMVLSILGVIVLVVAAIGIVNTMIMAVTERTKSIGVMKSVGASNSDIKSMFLFQSGAIGLVGGVIGSIISVILFKLISFGVVHMLTQKGQTVNLVTSVPIWLIIATIIFSIVVSVLAGVYPASRASKLDPVNSLRQ